MWIDKATTWRLAEALGGDRLVEADPRTDPNTRYLGERGAVARLGLWLRRVPGVQPAGEGVAGVCGGAVVPALVSSPRRRGARCDEPQSQSLSAEVLWIPASRVTLAG